MKTRITTGLLAALCVAAAGAVGATPPAAEGGPPIDLPLDADLTTASLTAVPSNDDLAREYPRIPLMMGLAGNATMSCKVLTTGRLDDCHVLSEAPAGMGFGAATIRTSIYFRVTPAKKNGQPVEGVIAIPLRWQTDQPPAVQETALPPASPAALQLARRVVELEDVTSRMQAFWHPMIQQQTAQLAETDDVQAGQKLLDAFQEGLTDAIQAETERQAHELASRLSEPELNSVIGFLSSPAGLAWSRANAQSSDHAPNDFIRRVADAARSHFCQLECPTAALKAKPPPSNR